MSGADHIEENAAKGQQYRCLADGHIQRVQPEAAADIDFQFPANQQGIEQGGHQQGKKGISLDGDAAGQVHSGCGQ